MCEVLDRAEARGFAKGFAEGFAEGFKEGFKEGLKEGFKEGFKEGSALKDLTEGRVVAYYDAGYSVEQIAEKIEISKEKVQEILALQ